MTTEEGTKPPTVRLVPLLVANLTMILFGITAGLTTSGAKWFIFGGALCFGGFVFSSAIQVMTIDLTLVRSPSAPFHVVLLASHPSSPLYRPVPHRAGFQQPDGGGADKLHLARSHVPLRLGHLSSDLPHRCVSE